MKNVYDVGWHGAAPKGNIEVFVGDFACASSSVMRSNNIVKSNGVEMVRSF